MKNWKKIFSNNQGMSLIQTMVMVAVLGTMTTVFMKEADQMNKQTRILNVQSRTDEVTKEIASYLSSQTDLVTMLAGGSGTGSSCNTFAGSLTFPFPLQTPHVAIDNVQSCVQSRCDFTGTSPARKCGNLYPGEQVWVLRFMINRNTNNAKGTSIVSVVKRELTIRVFVGETGSTPVAAYPESSEAYYSRLFCENMGGWVEANGSCNNQFSEKSCAMMGGVWDKDANTCLKDAITCEWLTGDASCWQNNQCMFPTEGAWTYQGQNWSACNSCHRTRTAVCEEGQCNKECFGNTPQESTSQLPSSSGNWRNDSILPYSGTIVGATFPAYLDDPNTCRKYGRYTSSGSQYCDGRNQCRIRVRCTSNTCTDCDPGAAGNSPVSVSGYSGGRGALTTTAGWVDKHNNSTCGSSTHPGSWDTSASWGPCNASTCQQTRPVPMILGSCGAHPTSAQPATSRSCSIDGGWSSIAWGSCSNCAQTATVTCSAMCGGTCGNPPAGCNASGSCTQGCGEANGSWQTTTWGGCSSCSQSRTVSCNGTCGGVCPGTSPSTVRSCGAVDGSWSTGSWGTCTTRCRQTRTVTCSGAACGGATCTGTAPATSQRCTGGSCVTSPPPPPPRPAGLSCIHDYGYASEDDCCIPGPERGVFGWLIPPLGTAIATGSSTPVCATSADDSSVTAYVRVGCDGRGYTILSAVEGHHSCGIGAPTRED